MIKIGKTVSWTYQAGGVEFSQKGKLISELPTGSNASLKLVNFDANASPRQKKFQDISSNDRYLIAVKNEHGVMMYYAPTQKLVDTQNPKAVKEYDKEFNSKTLVENNVPTLAVTEKAPTAPKSEVMAAPAMDSDFTMGNATSYRICGISQKGFIGYRIFKNSKIKFLVAGDSFDWTYPSSVRKANSGFCKAFSKNEEVSNLSLPETVHFVSSLTKQLTIMGFKVNTARLLKDLQNKTTDGFTRREIKANFTTSSY